MTAKILMAISAGLVFLLGAIHLVYTFSGTKLMPRDPALRTAMGQVPLGISEETTVLRAWIGFNASHGLGLILFGLVFGFMALNHTKFLFGSSYLLAVGFIFLAGLLVLSRLFWFSIPFAGLALALGCFVASIIAARA